MTQHTHDESSDNQEAGDDDRFAGRTGSAAELHAAPDMPTRAELRALASSMAAQGADDATELTYDHPADPAPTDDAGDAGDDATAGEDVLGVVGRAAEDARREALLDAAQRSHAENGGLLVVEDVDPARPLDLGLSLRDNDRALAAVIWNFLGTNDPALLSAWFDKLHAVARARGGVEIAANADPITWESVR
jgi:hypothetical protein